jgi:hypothetical protein
MTVSAVPSILPCWRGLDSILLNTECARNYLGRVWYGYGAKHHGGAGKN